MSRTLWRIDQVPAVAKSLLATSVVPKSALLWAYGPLSSVNFKILACFLGITMATSVHKMLDRKTKTFEVVPQYYALAIHDTAYTFSGIF